MKKILFALSLLLSLTIRAQTIAPGGWMRFKRVLTADEVKGCFTTPVTLIAPQGSNKIVYVDPYSVAIKLSAGTGFNFGASYIYIGDFGLGYIACMLNHVEIDGSTFLTAGFTADATIANNGQFNFPTAIGNNGIYFSNDAVDSALGTRTVTVTFNYCILNLN